MSGKIYTKTGDHGQTKLVDGSGISKASLRIEATGSVDELNCHLGILICYPEFLVQEKERLIRLQQLLFVIGAKLTVDHKTDESWPGIKMDDIHMLEQSIDEMYAQLPAQKYFILPGGHPTVASIHLARAVCRRAERDCVRLKESGAYLDESILIFLNRLSDFFFSLSRFIAFRLKLNESFWLGASAK